MNIAIIALLVVSLAIGLVAGVNALTSNESAPKISCSTCGNSCTAENNCGLATCGATQGKTCGCGK
ncbi:hypothetical protein JXB27_01075 [Candidatus Woesearchaeota archaeon]|nr:hypothetical protein [Candidatus Woesearchaeota archaeon]